MKKILLITEKPHNPETFLKQAIEANDTLFTENEIWVAYCHSGSAPIYDYPKNIKYKDYPKCNPLKLKWNDNFQEINPAEYKIVMDNVKHITRQSDFSQDFDALIVMQDPDSMSAFYAESLLELVYGENYEERFSRTIYSNHYTTETMYSRLYSNQEVDKKAFFDYARVGKVKKWFQFNYNFNSSIFYTEILNYLDIKTDIKMSKYMVHMIHTIYNPKYCQKILDITEEQFDKKGIHDYKLIQLVDKYKGSGKYAEKDKYYWGYLMGTPGTIGSILGNLIKLGFLVEVDKSVFGRYDVKYHKTDLGKKFFNLLNKNTFDIDMPFRLKAWEMELFEGKDVSGKMADYLYNCFIGQKRKNNKTLR